MINIKDLRNLNKEEFKEVYEYLKEETKNFTNINPSLILKNNQYLLILRIILGLSQKEFGNKLGTTKDWCRHLESGWNKIEKLKIILRYTDKLQELFNSHKVNFDKAIETWNRYNYFSKDQILPEPEIKLKPISKMSESELEKCFQLIKKETNNFTLFQPELLTRIPQSIVIFRIVLRINHRDFSQIIESNTKGLRDYEHGRTKIKPLTAIKIINIIKELFKNKKLIKFNKVLENYRILRGFYGNRNLDFLVNQGLNRLAKFKPTAYEEEIAKLFEKEEIKFERYKILEGIKNKFNIDFFIPDKNIAIEVFAYNNKKRGDIKLKACFVDHRFQILKLKNSSIKTIMCIQTKGKPILHDYVKKYINNEIVNTDFLLINKEINKLKSIIKRL